MEEQVRKASGINIPATHGRGKRPICGVFATKGVRTLAATVLERYEGIGDHRILMLDLESLSVTGDKHPRIMRPAARLMNSDNERHRDKYNEVLEELCDRHRLHDKLLKIHNIPLEEEARFVEEMNKWDKEMEDCMKAAEKKAVKKRNVQ